MTLPIVLASALAVTNAPSSFSTTVERTFVCPAISESVVGRRYHLHLPMTGVCRVELAVGGDANGDGKLADEESPLAVTYSRHALEVRNRQGVPVFESPYLPIDCPLTLDLKPGKSGTAATWRLHEEDSQEIAIGTLDDGDNPGDWTFARVRISGPSALQAGIEMHRLRDAFTFIIR